MEVVNDKTKISEILEISTGRISQIKKSIIEKLRNEIS